MVSPITGSNNCELVKSFSAKQIEKQYLSECSIDVARFFAQTEKIELYKCNDTGYRFYYPFDIFGDGPFYNDLNKNFKTYYVKERWEHVQAIKMLNTTMHVLEIGSGDGYFLEMMTRNKIICTGLELNKNAVEKSVKDGFEVYNLSVEQLAQKKEGSYDVVCFFQVLEHITDVKSFLTAALKCLKPGGFLIIGVPNNNPYIFRHDDWHTLNLPPHHAGLWDKNAFKNLVHFFPLELKKISIEPLHEYNYWFDIQKKYYRTKNKPLWVFLSIIPRPVYKYVLRLFRYKIEGRNIFAVYAKTGSK